MALFYFLHAVICNDYIFYYDFLDDEFLLPMMILLRCDREERGHMFRGENI